MKSVVYLLTVAVIFLLEEIDGNQIQSSNLSCALVPGRSNSTYYEPVWDYIWIRRSCMFGRVFSDRYCLCIPTQLMRNTRLNTPNTCIFRGSKTYTRRIDPKDSYYQERVKTRKWAPKTCTSGLVFSPTHCRCIEDSRETCQYPGGITRTRKRDTDVNYFQQLTNSNTWERKRCYSGATFSLTKCYCTFGGSSVIVTTPEPENDIKICKHPKYGYFRKRDSNPQFYFQINNNKAWEKRACAVGGTFNSAICDCTYVKPTSESETTPKVEPEIPQKFCWDALSKTRRGTFRDERYYYELKGNTWKVIACQNGYIFSHDRCCCVLKSQITTPRTEPTGEPETEPTGEPETPFEVCPHKPSQSIRRATTNPQIYEQKTTGGKWVKISCEAANQFNVKKCCCVPTGTTAQPEGTTKFSPKYCLDKLSSKRRATFRNERHYYELTDSLWRLKACKNGKIFSYEECCCVLKSKPKTEPTSKPETEPTGEPETEPTGEPEAQFEICPHKSSQSIRRGTANPQFYEQMNKQGKWERKLCNGASRFNAKKCCCVSPGEPETEPTGEPETEPTGEPETEPTGEPETEPTGEPETEPTGEPETPFEVCWHKPSQSIRRGTKNPQIYEQMNKQRKWERKICNGASRFNAKKCCCVSTGEPETEPTGEPETEPEGKPEGEPEIAEKICHHKPSKIQRKTFKVELFYYEKTGNTWMLKVCQNGYIFSYEECCCALKSKQIANPETEPEGKPESEPEGEPEGEPKPENEVQHAYCIDVISRAIRKNTTNPKQYKQLSSSFKWEVKYCPHSKRFSFKICCCVPVTPGQPEGEPEGKPETEPEGKPETEPETEPEGKPEKPFKICPHKPSESIRRPTTNPQFYEQMTIRNEWVNMSCGDASRFDVDQCSCIPTEKTTPTTTQRSYDTAQANITCKVGNGPLRKTDSDLRRYSEKVAGRWEDRICYSGGIFNKLICGCVYLKKIHK
ncbi:uncharacterized protein LOC115217256 isoform X4 [Octopus sinensis]|uniref:Uncharacterized protein LOC115217256 isoform X4 n=1 Tax=Octopus sinensis TaxID=2607531 RepID=A0A7E6F5H7_9MOLL|nr:uncharacterized protein LOC115217256 isoform X4 [Octopus sinensis]